MDFVHGMDFPVSSVSFESHGDSGGGSSLTKYNSIFLVSEFSEIEHSKFNTYLNIPGDSSPPLATPGSDVSLRSEIDETFRRD